MIFIKQYKTSLAVFSVFLVLSNSVVPCIAAEKITCYHGDVSGNIVAVTDDSGNVISSYDYSPYGRTLALDGSSDNAFKFSGSFGITEELPDLYFMRARYYSADAARFLSTDPVKNIDPGWKYAPYEYVSGNPLVYSDPEGELLFTTFAILAIAVPAITSGVLVGGYAAHKSREVNGKTDWGIVAKYGGLSAGLGALYGAAAVAPHYLVPTLASGAYTSTASYVAYKLSTKIILNKVKSNIIYKSTGYQTPSSGTIGMVAGIVLPEEVSIGVGSLLDHNSNKDNGPKGNDTVKAGNHAQETNSTSITNAAKVESKKNTSKVKNVWKSVRFKTKKTFSKVKSWFKKWF